MSLPVQAVLCHLSDVVPRKNWSQADVDLLDESVKDKVLVADFKVSFTGCILTWSEFCLDITCMHTQA